MVAEVGWSELMTDTGTAVGLVASNEKLTAGVDEAGVPVVIAGELEPAAGIEAAAVVDAAEVDAAETDAAEETDEGDPDADAELTWRAW